MNRTPITAVSMGLLATRDKLMDTEGKTVMADMITSVDSCLEILNELLLVEKLNNQQVQLQFQLLSIYQYFRTILTPFRASARAKNLKFQLFLDQKCSIVDDLLNNSSINLDMMRELKDFSINIDGFKLAQVN